MHGATGQEPIRLALVGAGIFARDAHVPALLALGEPYQVVAVCSRTRKSAEILASQLPGGVDVCTDLNELLERDDIEALDIVVPIEVMPAVLQAALASGKHIISEKPMAPDVATAKRLLELHTSHPGPSWMVAENWRYEASFMMAADLVRDGEVGEPLLCNWASYFDISPGNKYYGTAWRRSGTFQGGYLLDGGVHRAAALRLILGEVAHVCAIGTQLRADLPPLDTLCAALRFDSGVVGSCSMTFAVHPPWDRSLFVVGREGSLRVERGEVIVDHSGVVRSVPLAPQDDLQAIAAELADFAAAIRQGTGYRNTPQEALQDLAVVEAMLESARTGQPVVPERFV